MAKQYTLQVSTKTPRGRSTKRVISAGGGAVYISGDTTTVPSTSDGHVAPGIADNLREPVSYASWRLVADPSAVKIHKGSAAPHVSCSVERISAGRTTRYTSPDSLTDEGVEVWMQIDGGDWQKYVIGVAQPIATQAGRILTTRSGRPIYTQGRDVDTAEVNNLVAFELRDTVTSRVYASVSVPIVRDGAMGATGPMVYPAGIWKPGVTYTASGACPAVQCDGLFFVLRLGETATDVNPAEDYALNGSASVWQPMESMQYVFADVLMANFAKLSAAVFYGDYMFSQDGTIDGVAVSGLDDEGVAYYTRFTDGKSAGSFIPNICVNFKSGYLAAAVGVFSGNIHTTFVEASASDAITDKEGVYEIRTQHKLLSTYNGAIFQLPNDASMIGSRVMICDPRITGSATTHPMIIKPKSGVIIGMSPDNPGTTSGVTQVWMYAGVCELLAVPKYSNIGVLDPTGCQWMILTIAARYTNSSNVDQGGALPVIPGGMFITDPNQPIIPLN